MSERKGKGICRARGRGEERSGDGEERRAEKGDERKERSKAGVRGGTFTGHLEFAAPTSDGIRAPFPLIRAFAPSPHPVSPPFDRGSGPVSPRLEAPTVHPRAAN